MEPHLPPPVGGTDVQGGPESSSANGYQLTNFERFLSSLVEDEIHHAADPTYLKMPEMWKVQLDRGFSPEMWNRQGGHSIDNGTEVPNAKWCRLDQKTEEEEQHGHDKMLEPDPAAGKDGPIGGRSSVVANDQQTAIARWEQRGATSLARQELRPGSRGVPFKADKTTGILGRRGSLKKGVLKKSVPKKNKDPLISDVAGVNWNKNYWRWQVDFKNQGQRLHKNFMAKGDSPVDVARAKKVAEDQRLSWEQEYKPNMKAAVKKGHGRRAMAAKVALDGVAVVTKAVSNKLAKASKP